MTRSGGGWALVMDRQDDVPTTLTQGTLQPGTHGQAIDDARFLALKAGTVQLLLVNSGNMIYDGGASSAIIAVLSFMESYAIGKKFADMNGYSMDIGQELFAIGVSNVVGSFFSAYPSAGSFSRTVVNGKAGSKSPFANAVTAGLLILTLVAITKALYYVSGPQLAYHTI